MMPARAPISNDQVSGGSAAASQSEKIEGISAM